MERLDITKWKDKIIEDTCKLINIPSIYEKSDDSEKTFGKGATEALEYMLNLGEELGFRTKNIDGYCGYIEFGKGEELIGIIGHLDVVPAQNNWKYKPFNATIEDGKIYGRGAIDDKGPVIASLYAMKAVMEQTKINKRVRLILGLNEERDWKCIEYYKKYEEIPTIGFSPDADFPCIYAEKGVLTTYISEDYSKKLNEDIIITKIDCNLNAINVVPKYCKIEIQVNFNKIDKKELLEYMNVLILKNKFNIEINQTDNKITLISTGIASHAAHPDEGVNAISMLLIILNDTFKKYNIQISILNEFSKRIGMQYNGENLGINYKDESGILTLNVGNCELVNNEIKIGINMRIPITIKIEDIKNELINIFKSYNIHFEGIKEPLYIDKDNKLIKILCETFNEVTGRNDKPIAIGGATYARAFKNCVSFGANMPGEKDMCHQVDEFIKIDNLLLTTKIYAEAIYKLAKENG